MDPRARFAVARSAAHGADRETGAGRHIDLPGYSYVWLAPIRLSGGCVMENSQGALAGLKVVEFAHVIAGPLAGTLLADLGAEVVHVEDPGHGDPQRHAGPAKNGAHLWWKVAARNKRSVTLDLRTDPGRDLARRLAAWADVVITNFRVETLEKWGLDWESLHAVNQKLIVLQVTGFGARSSKRNQPGFGKVGEAMSGV